MDYILSFLVSVGAGVVANAVYTAICKWLNEHRK